MIRKLTGRVADTTLTTVVLDVNGVGYLVHTTIANTWSLESIVSLWTYLAVRENALDLYGFTSLNELSFFELLLTLPKIGPKTALQILSQADYALIQHAIISQDPTHLSKMSGISKKTAEKIVFGLKDTFEHSAYVGQGAKKGDEHHQRSFSSDAIDALITLGYPQADARKAVQELTASKPEITNINDAIKEALKMLS